MFDFPVLAKERTVAGPGFNRWLVPPAALAIHLCIGMAYGLSVFWLPLSKIVGTACPADMSWYQEIFAANCDWKISTISFTFSLAIVVLGSAAALFGGWLEHNGPRKAGFIAAVCWSGGFLISAYGVSIHQLWVMWLGLGVLGGIGLGLGYISPVSTLVKWFPDRRGMATGLAIMGFGGGAMIGSPLAVKLMNHFATGPASPGVWQSFVVLAITYAIVMLAGAFGYRIAPAGWKPGGWTPAAQSANAMVTARHVHVSRAWKTPQFWLIWLVLMMNVSAGIGIIGMASPMLQEIFGGKLIGVDVGFNDLTPDQKKAIAVIAGAFTGLLSLFNIGGRIVWASLSDVIGRKATYFVFFVLGMILYYSAPSLGHAGNLALFVSAFCIILSMYGGGFATIPAYLADVFGTQMVGAIHGRLLTAWSTAGILGPVLVTKVREAQLAAGVPREQIYDKTLGYLVAMLAIGFVANLLIRPVADKWFMTDAQLANERRLMAENRAAEEVAASGNIAPQRGSVALWLRWLGIGLPLAWGVYVTLQTALKLFA
jgi:MFS family permease